MVDKHLIYITILIVYVCICWISVVVVINDPREILSGGHHYKTNEIIAEGASDEDLLPQHSKTLTDPLEVSSLRETRVLPESDFKQLIDLKNFEYLMQQPVCSKHIEALILIHSAPKNYEQRQIIRETWGSIANYTGDSPFRVLFLLGAVESDHLQNELLAENSHYKDFIQGSFIDDYRNMTYKHIMAFKWFLYNCPQAQILLKVDDDVYVNTPQLLKYIRQQQQRQPSKKPIDSKSKRYAKYKKFNIFSKTSTPSKFNASRNLFNHPENLLFCDKVINARVSRSHRSKWRISFKEYSKSHYPTYCSGYVLIYSTDVVYRLYKAAQNYKYFWVDDVQVTGILAHRTNTTITSSSSYILHSRKCHQLLSGKIDLHKMEFIYASYKITEQQRKSLWNLQMKSLKSEITNS